MNSSKQLKRQLALAALAAIAVLLCATTATFAWYVYNTSARTPRVKMSAGSSISLQIASKLEYDNLEKDKPGTGETAFRSAAEMEDMHTNLVPVSTDKIAAGFQAVTGFEQEQSRFVARHFQAASDMQEYYKTTLLLRTNAAHLEVYLSDIASEDREGSSLSTAMRLGLVIPDSAGQRQEFVFELNDGHNPNPSGLWDNASQRIPGYSGAYALDSTKSDGTVVPVTVLGRDALCSYNSATGETTITETSLKICDLYGGEDGGYGTPVPVDVYLWLEGCDEDCTTDLSGQAMKLVSLGFAGI